MGEWVVTINLSLCGHIGIVELSLNALVEHFYNITVYSDAKWSLIRDYVPVLLDKLVLLLGQFQNGQG